MLGTARGPQTQPSPRRAPPLATCSVPDVHFVIMGCGRVGATLARCAAAPRPHGRRHRPEPRRLPPARRRVRGDHGHRRRLRPRHPHRGRHRARLRVRGGVAAATTPTSSPRGSRARPSASPTSWPASTTPAAPRSTSGSASPPSPRCSWASDQMLRRLLPHGAAPVFTDASGHVQMAEYPVATAGSGRPLTATWRSRPARGSPSSPGSARACCRPRRPCTRRATRAPAAPGRRSSRSSSAG